MYRVVHGPFFLALYKNPIIQSSLKMPRDARTKASEMGLAEIPSFKSDPVFAWIVCVSKRTEELSVAHISGEDWLGFDLTVSPCSKTCPWLSSRKFRLRD
jgi:hypothetical protein